MSGAGPPSLSSLGSFKHSQRYANVATRYSQSRERERNAAEAERRGTEREALLDDAERGSGGSAGGTRGANGRSGWSCVKALMFIVLLVVVVVAAVVYGTGGLDGWMTRTDDDDADGKTSARTATDSARARRAVNDDEDEDAVSVRPPPPAIDVEEDEEEEEPLSPPPAPRRPPAPREPPAPSEEDEPASVDPYAVSPTPSSDDDDGENAYDDGEERDPSTVNDAADVGTKASSDAQMAATTTRAVERDVVQRDEAVETEDETPAIARVPESSLGQAILQNRRSARAVYKFEADPTTAPGIGPNVEPVTPREPMPAPRKGENK